MAVTVEVLEGLGPVAEAWDRVVDLDGANPFLRSWWLSSTTLGKARVVAVHDGPDLVGGLALERVVRGVAQLRMIGEELGAADLDLVADPTREAEVVESIGAWLAGRRLPTRFRLAGLRDGGRVAGLVPSGQLTHEGVAFSARTPASIEDYLASRSSNLRKDLGRSRRRVVDEHGAQVRLVLAGEVPDALARFHVLHGAQFGEQSQLTPTRAAFDQAVHAGVAAGEVLLHGVLHDGRWVAVEVMLAHGPRLGLLASAFDSTDDAMSGAGNLLSLHAFEHAIDHGFEEVDFLRGASGYKARWVDTPRSVMTATGDNSNLAKAIGSAPATARRLRRSLRSQRSD